MNILSYIIKRLNIIIACISVVALGATSVFLYNHLYKTLTQAEIVLTLQSQVSTASFNVSQWKRVIEHLEKKKQPSSIEPARVNDPFK